MQYLLYSTSHIPVEPQHLKKKKSVPLYLRSLVVWVISMFWSYHALDTIILCQPSLPPRGRAEYLNSIMCAAAAAAKSLQSCPTLCDPIDISPPGSPAPGILQARTLEWVAISFSNAWKWKSESEVAQSCPTLSNLMDCNLPGSSIHGIFQARVLEWVPLPSLSIMCRPLE